MYLDDKDRIYISGAYKDMLRKAVRSIYCNKEDFESIQMYSFNKNNDCYMIEVIDMDTYKVSTFILYKNTGDIEYIDDKGNEQYIKW